LIMEFANSIDAACGAAIPGRRPACLFLKPLRRADPLRHDAQADLFRRRLRHSTEIVQLGLITSVSNILIWASVGLVWWKILGC
jgi:hypothetical protein